MAVFSVPLVSNVPQVVQTPTGEQLRDHELRTTWRFLVAWISATVSTIVIYSSALGAGLWLKFVAGAVLLTAGCSSVGVFLGFIFGIPRSLSRDTTPSSRASTTGNAQQSLSSPSNLGVNTNLEEISDWLTKILVGVSLTKLSEIGPKVWSMAATMAPIVSDSAPIALTIGVNAVVWGFFVGYLLTRLFLASAFANADPNARLVQREERAFELTQKGAHVSAATQYQTALGEVSPSTSSEQRQRIYEGAVYNSLYLPPPDGYTKAIELAQEYLKNPSNLPSPRILAYLTAAYGQQYADMKDATPEQLKAVRDKALAAARETLRLDPRQKTLLHMLWDPNDPMFSDQEDDLRSFFGDEDFKKLLG